MDWLLLIWGDLAGKLPRAGPCFLGAITLNEIVMDFITVCLSLETGKIAGSLAAKSDPGRHAARYPAQVTPESKKAWPLGIPQLFRLRMLLKPWVSTVSCLKQGLSLHLKSLQVHLKAGVMYRVSRRQKNYLFSEVMK